MNKFRTLDDVDVKGKRVLLRVDLNVPMENGRVTDATRLERVGADHRRDFRQRRQGDPAGAFRPAEGTRRQGLAEAGRGRAFADPQEAGRLRGRLHRRSRRKGGRGDEGWRHPLPGKYPLPQRGRKERSGLRRSLAKLGDIWVNDAFSAAHRAHASTEGLGHKSAGLCRTHHAGRTRRAQQGAGSADQAGDRDHRRRQGLHQDRPSGKPGQQGRCAGDWRRHGQYLPACAGRRHRQIAGGKGSCGDRVADHGKGRGRQLRDHPARRRRGGVSTSPPTRRRTPMASMRSRPMA